MAVLHDNTSRIQGLLNEINNLPNDSSDEAYELGKSEGYSEGRADGVKDGYSEGYAKGHTEGVEQGYADGYNAGLSDGGDKSDEDAMISRTLVDYKNDRITSIGDQAFRENRVIKSVDFPNVVTGGTFAFYYCTALETAKFQKLTNATTNMFRGCSSLSQFDAPSLERLTNASLYGTALAHLDFAYMDYIDREALSGCVNLETLVLRKTAVVQLVATNAFTNTPIANGTGFVYVPDELVEQYKTATNWSAYASQIKPISELEE